MTSGSSSGWAAWNASIVATNFEKLNFHACEKNAVGFPVSPAVARSAANSSHSEQVSGGAELCACPVEVSTYSCT